jgi:hypothetical protein
MSLYLLTGKSSSLIHVMPSYSIWCFSLWRPLRVEGTIESTGRSVILTQSKTALGNLIPRFTMWNGGTLDPGPNDQATRPRIATVQASSASPFAVSTSPVVFLPLQMFRLRIPTKVGPVQINAWSHCTVWMVPVLSKHSS